MIALLVSVFFLAATQGSVAQKAPSSQKGKSKPVQLFNGRNLQGWYTYLRDRGRDSDPKKVFTVQDGQIRISGEEWGYLATEQEYENYKIVLEFKWTGETYEPRKQKSRDSGLLLHGNGKDGGNGGTWMHSIEVQIIEGGTGDFIVVGGGTGDFAVTSKVAPGTPANAHAHYFHPDGEPITKQRGRINWWGRDPAWEDKIDYRGPKDVENPVGEWNTLECHVVDDQITVFLNGIMVNKAYDVKPTKGKILIQSEGAVMLVRKVELTPLSADRLVSIHANDGKGVGPKIKLMPEWNAFGYFTSADHIEWDNITVPETATYDVFLEWSISDKDAGRPYVLQIGKTTLEGIVQKSGGWEDFKTIKIGTLKLKKGTYKGSFKPKGSFPGGLMDFREIRLVPR